MPSSSASGAGTRRATTPSATCAPAALAPTAGDREPASGVSGKKVDSGSAQDAGVGLRGPGPSSSGSYGCLLPSSTPSHDVRVLTGDPGVDCGHCVDPIARRTTGTPPTRLF